MHARRLKHAIIGIAMSSVAPFLQKTCRGSCCAIKAQSPLKVKTPQITFKTLLLQNPCNPAPLPFLFTRQLTKASEVPMKDTAVHSAILTHVRCQRASVPSSWRSSAPRRMLSKQANHKHTGHNAGNWSVVCNQMALSAIAICLRHRSITNSLAMATAE